MQSMDWNKLSELGLVERINREVLHPLGIAVTRDPSTGFSTKILISPDGIFEYSNSIKSTVKSDEFVLQEISKLREQAKGGDL